MQSQEPLEVGAEGDLTRMEGTVSREAESGRYRQETTNASSSSRKR